MKFSTGLFINILNDNIDDWKKQIEFIDQLENVGHIEVWLEYLDLSKENIKWLISKLSKYRLIVHGPFTNLSLLSIHENVNKASVNTIKRAIDISVELGAGIITVHGGSYPFFCKKDEVNNQFLINIKNLIKYADNRIDVVIENLSNKRGVTVSYPASLHEIGNIKKSMTSSLFTLDIGHCIQNGEIEYGHFISEYKESIKNIHIHNAKVHGKSHYGFNKKGDVSIFDIISILQKVDYSNFLTLEIIDKEDIKETWKLLDMCS
ncbi:MAG: sugar phosphate isomerase/epimerase family protein [Candidatus Magasanikbacteria bacterium]